MVKVTVFNFNGDKDKQLEKIDTDLPSPPFRWVLQGSTMCGKTNLIYNILYKWYQQYFDRFYIFCGSEDDIVNYERLTKKYKMGKKVWISKDVDMDEIQDLYDELENLNKKKIVRSLVVFDDQAFNNISSLGKKKNILDKILMAGRHINMSFLLSTQQYTALNKNMRSINISAFTIFACNDDELESIGKEHSNHLTKDEFVKMVKEKTSQKYNYVTIDRNKDIGDKFRDMVFSPIRVISQIQNDLKSESNNIDN